MFQVIYVPDSVYNVITGPAVGQVYFFIKGFFEIFSVILFIGIVLALYRISALTTIKAQLKELEGVGKKAPENIVLERWKKIKERLDTNDENNYKLAILEADAMFDSVLENTGYKGKDLEDRVKQVPPSDIPDIALVLEAHKLRNAIVYDAKLPVTYYQAKDAVDTFEHALKNLGVL